MEKTEIILSLLIVGVGWVLHQLGVVGDHDGDFHDDDCGGDDD